jgi:hypothetical protein
MALAWSAKKPTTSGWYWYRGKLADQVVLTCIGDGQIIIGNDVLPIPLEECPGEWFGPVAPCGPECRFDVRPINGLKCDNGPSDGSR